MRLYWLLAAILVLTYGVYQSVRYFTVPTPPNSVGPEKLDLSVSTQVANSEQLKVSLSSTAGSTLIFFIFPQIADRTSVVGNEYATAVNIGSKQIFKILIAPDAGRSTMMAPAALDIFVSNSADPEVIDINNIKLQRWNCVAIVRKGRKFNIYINGQLSASHTCTAMPIIDGTQTLRVGDRRLAGVIAQISMTKYPMELDEIQAMVRESMDAEGKPYLSSDLPGLPIPSFDFNFMCPGGNCNLPSKPNPMEQWNSSYA